MDAVRHSSRQGLEQLASRARSLRRELGRGSTWDLVAEAKRMPLETTV